MNDKTGAYPGVFAVCAVWITVLCMGLICGLHTAQAQDQVKAGALPAQSKAHLQTQTQVQAKPAVKLGQAQAQTLLVTQRTPAEGQMQAHVTVASDQSISCTRDMLIGAGNAIKHFQYLCTALNGKTIALDPGHQAHQNSSLEPVAPGSSTKKMKVTSGTQGAVTHIPEHELNLSVAFAMKARFEQCGANVVMTRTSADVNISNSERAKIANDAHADLCIHIHADGVDDKTVHGFMTLEPERKGNLSAEVVQRSTQVAQFVHTACLKATGAFDRGIIKRGDLTGCNWSEVPVIYIEVGCMTNPAEDELLQTAEYQKKIAQGTVEGVADWLSAGR